MFSSASVELLAGGVSFMTARIATIPVFAIACALGCGGGMGNGSGGSATFSATPIQTVRSDSGALSVAVYPEAGKLPARGVNAFRYVITNSTGAPVEGVQVAIAPWMPFMGHGSSVTPTVAAAGQGAYVVTNVYFPMAGRWDLMSTFSGAVTDAAKPFFDIQ